MAAAGIDGHDAPHGRHDRHGRVGTKLPPERPQMFVQSSMDHARLQPDTVGVGLEDAPHVAGEVDNDARSERFTGQSGAGSAGMDRQLVFRRVAHHRHHVGERPRPDHGHRADLEDAGVAGVELQEDVVATDVSLHQPAQVVFNSLAFLIHGNWENRTPVFIRSIGPNRRRAFDRG